MKLSLLVALLCCGCATTQLNSPMSLFEAYKEAYAAGDAHKMWDLTSPEGRRNALRSRARMLKGLTHKDPVQRVRIEGSLGVKAETIRRLSDKAFYIWAVHTIRRRLGPAYVSKAVLKMTPIRLKRTDKGVAILYRSHDNVEREFPMVRIGGRWWVDETPLPKEPETKDEP